jgi:glycosyltransferase involved in cell wall biosynthesis
MVYRLNLSEKVLFEGWKTDTVSYYKGSDALLVTSWYEGYGMVFKEAEAAGLKIVSTDVGIAKEIGARIVDWSPEKIAEGIIEVLK